MGATSTPLSGWIREIGMFVTLYTDRVFRVAATGFEPDMSGIDLRTVTIVPDRTLRHVRNADGAFRIIGATCSVARIAEVTASLPLWSDPDAKREGNDYVMTLDVALRHPVFGVPGMTVDQIVDAYTETETAAA